jgi:hypothetical protein
MGAGGVAQHFRALRRHEAAGAVDARPVPAQAEVVRGRRQWRGKVSLGPML